MNIFTQEIDAEKAARIISVVVIMSLLLIAGMTWSVNNEINAMGNEIMQNESSIIR